MNLSTHKFENTKGFSIYEIIAVVIILSVLLSLLVPNYSLQLRRGENQEAEQILRAIWVAEKEYQLDHGVFATNISQLDITIPTLQNFIIYPQQQNIICGANIVNSLAHMHKVVNGSFQYEIILISDGRISCFPCGGVCQKMGYDPF
ncbi:MAG: hypothetical protein AB7S78_05285 [Candidatus Omnitrophota bacterium]